MIKYKLLISSLCICIFFVFDWHVSNIPEITGYENGFFSLEEVIYNMHSEQSGYQGLLQCGVIYALIFCMYLEYMIRVDRISYIIRLVNRIELYKTRCKMILPLSVSFVVVHQCINIVLCLFEFGVKIIGHYNFIEYSLTCGSLLIIYYISIGTLYSITKDLCKKTILTLFIVVVFLLIEFFLQRITIIIPYLPISDLATSYPMLFEERYFPLTALIRQIVICILLNYILTHVVKKKDFLSDGK